MGLLLFNKLSSLSHGAELLVYKKCSQVSKLVVVGLLLFNKLSSLSHGAELLVYKNVLR